MRFLLLAALLTGCGMIPEDEEKKLAQTSGVRVTCNCVVSGGGFETETYSVNATASDCAGLQARILSQCRATRTTCTLGQSSCPHLYL